MRLFLIFCLFLVGCGPIQTVAADASGTPILIRSPQPSAKDLAHLEEKYQIQTVLNLRGSKLNKDWYQEESQACSALGLNLIDTRTVSTRPPSLDSLSIFFSAILDDSKHPILMHCQGGIHRTGAFVALYRIHFQGWTPAQAISELEANYFDFGISDRDRLKVWIYAHRDSLLGGLISESLKRR